MRFGSALLSNSNGKGLVPETVASEPEFLAAVGLSAAVTVLVATRLGFPVSTTHALAGALLGAGFGRTGSHVSFVQFGGVFAVPLLASPFMATWLAYSLYRALGSLRTALGIGADTCACAAMEPVPVTAGDGGTGAVCMTTAAVATEHDCASRYEGPFVALPAAAALDLLHLISAAAVSFAWGINDTPKIGALVLTIPLRAPQPGILVIGGTMCAGGFLGARPVAEMTSHRITAMGPG